MVFKSSRRSRRHRNAQQAENQAEPFFTKSEAPKVQTKKEDAFFQPKLKIGQPGDQYEKEADAVADQVVSGAGNQPAVQQKGISSVQRYMTNAEFDEKGTNTERIEEDKRIQEKPEVQREEAPEEEVAMQQEEEPVQEKEEEAVNMQTEEPEEMANKKEEEEVAMKEEEPEEAVSKKEEEEVAKKEEEPEEMASKKEEEDLQTKTNASANSASPQLTNQIKSRSGRGKPMDAKARTGMESAFQRDFSGVNIHTDQEAVEMNRELGAQAFTHGKDVYFNSGKYNPDTTQGKRLLAHELTHVVQQNSNIQRKPSTPAVQLNGEPASTEKVQATDDDKREFLEMTIHAWELAATHYALPAVKIDQAVFDRVMNSWYKMVTEGISVIKNDLKDDPELKERFKKAYHTALKTMMTKAAKALNVDITQLYQQNTGRIPLWAWEIPHQEVPGFSLPVPEGTQADPVTGNIELMINGVKVTVKPDAIAAGQESAGLTHSNYVYNVAFQYERPSNKITSFTVKKELTLQITYQTAESQTATSGYGRGTTEEDKSGGKVDPRSTTVGFHESMHAFEAVDAIRHSPPPVFDGAIGMQKAIFIAKAQAWNAAWAEYTNVINQENTRDVHCTGTTIDDFNKGQGEITNECNQ